MTTRTAIFAAAALLLAPLAVHAQLNNDQYAYRCTGKDGKKYYGQTIPPACLGLPLRIGASWLLLCCRDGDDDRHESGSG